MARKIHWTDFSAPEFDNIDPDKTIAIIPIAAVEQHGPHLPVGTDMILNQGCLDLLIERAPADLDIRILPIQQVGKSNEHIWAKGTVTHTAHTLIDAWFELGQSVSRAGVKKLVFINSHGGNEEIMGIVARELRVRENMLVVKSGWTRFQPPDGMLSDIERRHGIHAGDLETSLMLAFHPELVHLDKLEDFRSIAARDEQHYKYLRPTGTHAYAWIASDLNPAGAVGNAANASAERGRIFADAEVSGMLELLAEVERFPLPPVAG
ncbi:MAG: creatininase family protein [Hyphomicrobiales bacterium]|nr:MAG: creatininase family protein [Hyphomicrobiales bacterium]